MELKTLNESIEDRIILKRYKNLKDIISQLSATLVVSDQENDYSIKLRPRKMPLFSLLQNIFQNKLKVLYEHIDENFVNGSLFLLKSLTKDSYLVYL